MRDVNIRIKKVASQNDIHIWEDHMLDKARCWNKFCLGICNDNEVRAVQVEKEGNTENTFITTLCEDCINSTSSLGILVNESHLMIKPQLHNK